MLFHITVEHTAQDCPGRHPTAPPDLVAPSDTREGLGRELGVKLHFVLWGAACMLWAQPDHLAFAVLEAEDMESALQYVRALVPEGWSSTALPVWNLPAQLGLIRQIRLAPPMSSSAATSADRPTLEPGPRQTETSAGESAGTITRMIRGLDTPTAEFEAPPEQG
ncbi:MAG: hypothetical protein JO352_29275 [Chloroflexi bacterium]|nr:hypothetical protein [Chloroflexota bacterium]